MKQENQKLRQMDVSQLMTEVDNLRRELLTLRLNAKTSHVKSYPSMKKALEKGIARALTHARQKVNN